MPAPGSYHHLDDDDDVPPGFEGRRARPGPQGCSAGVGPAGFPTQQHRTSGPGGGAHFHQQQHHHPRQQPQQQLLTPPPQQPQHAGPAHANGHQPRPYQQASRADSVQAVHPQVAAGAARNFHRALSGSVAASQQQQQQQAHQARGHQPGSPTAQAGSPDARRRSGGGGGGACLAPDYGEYNDSDGEYGSKPAARRRGAGGNGSSSSSLGSSRAYHSAGNLPTYQQQQQQQQQQQPRRAGGSPGQQGPVSATGSPVRGSVHAQLGSVSAHALGRTGSPLQRHPRAVAMAAAAAAAASTAQPSPLRQGSGGASAAAAAAAATPGGGPKTPSPEPDYGHLDSDDEYGADVARRPAPRRGGSTTSSSRQSPSGPRPRAGPGSSPLSPGQAVAAASQALAGISTPPGSSSSRQHGSGGRRSGGRRGGGAPLTAERTAELEEELAKLKAALADMEATKLALAEAEAREVEAHMAVISLTTDNSSLHTQLQGMRQQKQQLEQMLLFGTDQEPSSGDLGRHSSSQSEGYADDAAALEAALPDEEELLGPCREEAEQQAGGEGGADAGDAADDEDDGISLTLPGLDLEIAEALAAADAAADAAVMAVPAAPARSKAAAAPLSAEIAEAVAAAEAAADAAATAH